jgi:hypothetical protein
MQQRDCFEYVGFSRVGFSDKDIYPAALQVNSFHRFEVPDVQFR